MTRLEFNRAVHQCGMELACYAAKLAGLTPMTVAMWRQHWDR